MQSLDAISAPPAIFYKKNRSMLEKNGLGVLGRKDITSTQLKQRERENVKKGWRDEEEEEVKQKKEEDNRI